MFCQWKIKPCHFFPELRQTNERLILNRNTLYQSSHVAKKCTLQTLLLKLFFLHTLHILHLWRILTNPCSSTVNNSFLEKCIPFQKWKTGEKKRVTLYSKISPCCFFCWAHLSNLIKNNPAKKSVCKVCQFLNTISQSSQHFMFWFFTYFAIFTIAKTDEFS